MLSLGLLLGCCIGGVYYRKLFVIEAERPQARFQVKVQVRVLHLYVLEKVYKDDRVALGLLGQEEPDRL